MHSDPRFPDCPPGKTEWPREWISCDQGNDLDTKLQRLATIDWLKPFVQDDKDQAP